MTFFDWVRGEKPKKKKKAKKQQRHNWANAFSTHSIPVMTREEMDDKVFPARNWLQEHGGSASPTLAMDSDCGNTTLSIKDLFSLGRCRISDTLLSWYVSQSFIGYQACAVIAQHWLVNKACSEPGKAATRNGWEIKLKGEDAKTEIIEALRAKDVEFSVTDNLVQYSQMCRIFGIRIALFEVESDDPEYYEKPFNIDGVKPGSYKGISQIDPYWCVPLLTEESVDNPAGRYFYDPEYWIIGSKKYHRSHLVIRRYVEVPDILKPTYLYGGVPLTQMIMERVYCAERTANEAPQLTLTKRMNVRKTDLTKVVGDPERTRRAMEAQTFYRDNYGQMLINEDDEYEQHETSLADLDAVIMTQYQLVAAVANVPATELIGTTPKGFQSTGQAEKDSFNKTLKTVQTHEQEPLLDRHYLLMAKSEVEPIYGKVPEIFIAWNPLDEPAEEELADINLKKAQYYSTMQDTGAVSAEDIADVITKDPRSGFDEVNPQEPDLINENEAEEGQTSPLSDYA